MLPNLKCGGVVVNEFRVMRGRKRGSFGERDRRFESAFLQRRDGMGQAAKEVAPSSLQVTD
jgi:hypothetical protein